MWNLDYNKAPHNVHATLIINVYKMHKTNLYAKIAALNA